MKSIQKTVPVLLLAAGMAVLLSFTIKPSADMPSKGDRSWVIIESFEKLDPNAQSALISLMDDSRVALSKSSSKSDAAKLAKLKKHIAEMEKKLAERMKPMWMAADGSTYDNYNDYHDHQWGTNPGDGWHP